MSGDLRSTDILLQGCSHPPGYLLQPGLVLLLLLPTATASGPFAVRTSLGDGGRAGRRSRCPLLPAGSLFMEISSGPSCSTRRLCQRRGERLTKTPARARLRAGRRREMEAGRGALLARGGHPLRGLRCSLGTGLDTCHLGCSEEETLHAQSWANPLHPQLRMLCSGIISAISHVPALAGF